jgi:hypothetical protein
MEEVLICKVCYDRYNSESRCPINLPCGHTFCKNCISSLQKRGPAKCPLCKATASSQTLPKAFAILEILEALQKKPGGLLPIKNCSECKTEIHEDYYQCAKCIDFLLCLECKIKKVHSHHCFKSVDSCGTVGGTQYPFAVASLQIHANKAIICNGCAMAPIKGKVYQCLACKDIYICQVCLGAGLHTFHNMKSCTCEICNGATELNFMCKECHIVICLKCKNANQHSWHRIEATI